MYLVADRERLEEVRIYSKRVDDGSIMKLLVRPVYSKDGLLMEGIWNLLMMNLDGRFVPVKQYVNENDLMPALSGFKVRVIHRRP